MSGFFVCSDRDPKNDGLFNKLFPPYAGNDASTIRQDFNLLKQVMPNGENMTRLCRKCTCIY